MQHKQQIIHICADNKGGTEKYVKDLIKLFPEYTHSVFHNSPLNIENFAEVKLIHIHATFFESNIEWGILDIIDQFRKYTGNSNELPIYLTIHDYQWLLDGVTSYTYDNIDHCLQHYKEHNIDRTAALFNKVTRIIFPSQNTFAFYMKFIGAENIPLDILNKMSVMSHCDIPIRMNQLYIPRVNDNIINIAFIGQFNYHKGGRLFLDLIYSLREYRGYTIHYHIFGKHEESSHDDSLRDYVHFHGRYNPDDIIDTLYENNIHIQTSLSIFEETYCYALSSLINSGLPIVYFNQGALRTRLSCEYPRMFPFEKVEDMRATIGRAIDYVIAPQNSGRRDLIKISNEVVLNHEYKELYL
jgi:hypothetical protein